MLHIQILVSIVRQLSTVNHSWQLLVMWTTVHIYWKSTKPKNLPAGSRSLKTATLEPAS